MHNTEPRWKSMLRAEVTRTSLRSAQKLLGYSKSTIGMVLSGTYKRDTKKIATRVLERLKPPPKPRATKPAQLKQIDPTLHKQFKRWAELLTAKTVADVIGIEQQRVWPLIRGTDKHGAADVIAKLNTKLAEVSL